ncbi:hypothetical protein LGD64_000001 [Escherichia coli]|uniref:hypothetical protein n=1 Tax=Escherichia coli TaxID=562 RepID=UPI000B005839|nr:hypothetical protein [Escherichia coli]EHT2173077.1 hypothetical protein [Escherichia coli O168]EHY2107760.1 hypothetical protein [Escherichia coli O157]EEG9012926.1 hypothetical protein [Escherichia coli]EEG9026756.1 hypothetical protein [Escherichia coli]EEG9526421.1 hypothetical protein [Escherichia coli]
MTDLSIDITQMNSSLFCHISQKQHIAKFITIINGKVQKIIPLNAFNTASYVRKVQFLILVMENHDEQRFSIIEVISGKREGYEGRAQQNAMKEGVREFLVKTED